MRTISPKEFISYNEDTILVLDIRRDDDYQSSEEIVSGATWKDPAKIEEWISSVPTDESVIIYCVRGGGVSNSVVDRLQAGGIDAKFIEGGIEGFKEVGGLVEPK